MLLWYKVVILSHILNLQKTNSTFEKFIDMKRILFTILLLVVISWGDQLKGQISSGGMPLSFTKGDVADYYQEIAIPVPSPEELYGSGENEDKLNLPHRFAKLIPVNFNPENSGTWLDLEDGSRVWRLAIYAENAEALCLYYDDFYLPKGYKLFLYDGNKNQVKGAFTSENNHKSRLFATELVSGDFVTIELYQPKSESKQLSLNISDVAYAYKNGEGVTGFGGSDPCEVNVNCSPEGDNWQDNKRSVVRINVKVGGGLYWCSGSLLNNVRSDQTPYVLTANHCALHSGNYASSDDLNQWLFYFNYEGEGCVNPGNESEIEFYTMTGATKIANADVSSGSDFYLVELNNDIPGYRNPFFNGWSASGEISDSGVTIHHPEGDIKKISTYNAPLILSQWMSNGVNSHWKVFWVETDNEWGVTEGGSSGSPLYDIEGKLIGTLTGGLAYCGSSGEGLPDYYGAFFYHWDQNGTNDTLRLKPWLDPDNTGVSEFNGSYVGVEESIAESTDYFEIYPNPVDNKMRIKFNNPDLSFAKIEIYNTFGMKFFEIEQKNNLIELAIDTKSLKPGVYFVRVNDKTHSSVKRFIKN